MRFTEVSFNAKDGDFVLIGNQSKVYENMQIGMDSLSIKVASQSIIATFRILIPNVIISNNSAIYNDNVKRIFDLRNNWDITIDNTVRFRNMRTFESNLEYSSSSKGVEIDLTLHGSLYSSLNYIRIGNLKFNYPKPNEKMTLEWAVKELMRASKERIRFYNTTQTAIDEPAKEAPITMSFEQIDEQLRLLDEGRARAHVAGQPTEPFINAQKELRDLRNLKRKEIKIVDDLRNLTPDEEALDNFDESSIPDFDAMDVIVIAKNATSASVEYAKVWQTELDETKAIRHITNKDDQDKMKTSAALLEEILRERGLQLIQLPYIENGGASNILIIPLTAIASGEYKEYVRQKAATTYGKTGFSFAIKNQNVPKIDLLSVNNGVLSIEASTTRGKESQASVIQSHNVAFDNKDESDAGEVEKSIFNILEQTAKSITIEALGLPNLNYYATYSVEFIGDMFTGTYKVIEFEHKITGNKFTTSFEAVRIDNLIGKSSSEAAAEYNDDGSKNKEAEVAEEDKSWFDSQGVRHSGAFETNIAQDDDDNTNTWYDSYGVRHRD